MKTKYILKCSYCGGIIVPQSSEVLSLNTNCRCPRCENIESFGHLTGSNSDTNRNIDSLIDTIQGFASNICNEKNVSSNIEYISIEHGIPQIAIVSLINEWMNDMNSPKKRNLALESKFFSIIKDETISLNEILERIASETNKSEASSTPTNNIAILPSPKEQSYNEKIKELEEKAEELENRLDGYRVHVQNLEDEKSKIQDQLMVLQEMLKK